MVHIDALRGVALLGIILVNIWAFADPYFATSMRDPHRSGTLDTFARMSTTLLFETKFYLLFSFLFGLSLVLQQRSAERAGRSFLPGILRRQSGLVIIGVAHAALLYSGDILSTYGLLGVVLLAARALSDRAALWLAGAMTGVAGLAWMGLGVVLIDAGLLAGGDPGEALARAAAFGGSSLDTLAHLLAVLPEAVPGILMIQGPGAFSAFLVGMVIGRRGTLRHHRAPTPLARRAAAITLPIGLAGSAVYSVAVEYYPGGGLELIAFGLDVITAPFLTFTYAVVALAVLSARDRLRTLLAAPGRMSLTNYVGQSLVLALVFTGYGLGLVGAVSPIWLPVVATAVLAIQVVVSRWWLARMRYGPAEWLLRAWTTWTIPRWRVDR